MTITVDGEELGEGDHDWTISVDDETESGSVTVGDEEDGGDDS